MGRHTLNPKTTSEHARKSKDASRAENWRNKVWLGSDARERKAEH